MKIELVAVGDLMAPQSYFSDAAELPDEIRHLIEMARHARKRAVPTFSNFSVGAAVETKTGEIFPGSNCEGSNADTRCAEPSALTVARQLTAVPPLQVVRIAIIGGMKDQEQGENILTPCGRCRQFMLDQEIAQRSPIQVICASLSRGVQVFREVRVLIPFAFEGTG